MYNSYGSSRPKPYHSVELPKTFPEDIQCIIKSKIPDSGSLYISNVEAASNPNTLKKHKISAILSCAKGYQLKHPKTIVPHYKYIPTIDHDDCDISIHFDQAVDFIKQKLRHSNVLAHCIAGVSRSVSMVLAYLIREHNMNYDEAYRLVKSKRKIIHPNDGFIRQLKKYSETVRRQKSAEKSPRLIENVITLGKQRERTQLSPHREVTPQKSEKERTYQRYSSQYISPMNQNYLAQNSLNNKRQQVVQSLPYIPDTEQIAKKEQTLTPRAKAEEKYQLNRTSTNYFTPNKTLVNQKPYDNIRSYEDYSRSVKLQRPISTNMHNTISPTRETLPNRGQERLRNSYADSDPFNNNRGEYFASKNTELNEKIEMIRKKYAAEREKLFNKYQSPQKAQEKTDPLKNNQKRRVSLGQYKTDRPATKTYDLGGQRKYDLYKTDFKRQTLFNKIGSYQTSYKQIYSKKYERINNIGNNNLNEEQSYYNKHDNSLRNNINQANQQQNLRDYDRFGGLVRNTYEYSNYSPYYKYTTSNYKKYY